MSQSWISDALRTLVRERAHGLCEYCLIHESDTVWGLQVDHVIAEKHHGPTADHNLCYACPACNRAKGSDLTTVVSGKLVRLFNPRIDIWSEHFVLDGPLFKARSRIGNGTIRLLGINDSDRLEMRRILALAGSYPSAAAMKVMASSMIT